MVNRTSDDDPDLTYLRREFRRWRRYNGWSQDRVKDATGVAQKTVSELELCKTAPGLANLTKLRTLMREWDEPPPGWAPPEDKDSGGFKAPLSAGIQCSSCKAITIVRGGQVSVCGNCAKEFLKTCKKCGHRSPEMGAKFCMECGTALV